MRKDLYCTKCNLTKLTEVTASQSPKSPLFTCPKCGRAYAADEIKDIEAIPVVVSCIFMNGLGQESYSFTFPIPIGRSNCQCEKCLQWIPEAKECAFVVTARALRQLADLAAALKMFAPKPK